VDNNANLLSPQPIVTGEGDVLIQWIRQTGPFWAANSELYLQKYDYDSIAQWSNPIVAAGPVVFPMGNWSQQSVADADSGSFSAWTEMSGSVQSAVVQHSNGDGTLSWTGGVDLSTNSSNFRMSPMLTVGEETQELMAVWREANGSQSQRGVYAQRLDSSGNRLWGNNGTAVVALNSNYDYLDLSVAGFGDDLIAAYIEQSVNTNGDIYADRLDTNGNNVWAGGAATVTNSGSSKSDMMIDKGTGCLFIAWTENDSVYIHCLREDGTLGGPYNFSPTEFSLTEPSNNTEIMIDASNVDIGSITFSWDESSDANDDALYYFMRATSAEIGNYGFGTTATSIGVSYMDIIEDMAENNVTVATLEWTVHVTDGIDTVEADNAPFTVAIDGGYAMSTFSEALIPEVFALHQNYPNPFNPVTTLRYDLPENSYVNVTVYDMIGREVRTLVNTTQDAGFKSVIWDATNDYGKPVSAGVYLYKIQAGEYISTKKMVLLK
jgi:hypothetical protein